jgi:hypothetical protein
VLHFERLATISQVVKEVVRKEKILSVTIGNEVTSDIFKEIEQIESLSILRGAQFDISYVYNLKKLRNILIDNTHDYEIDFSKFTNLCRLDISYNKNIIGLSKCHNLTYLKLNNYTEKDLTKIDLPSSLEVLFVVDSNIESLNGIEQIKNAKGLELAYLPKLTDYASLEYLHKVEYLHFQNCKDLNQFSSVVKMTNLKLLLIENCRGIKSLLPLQMSKSLQGVRLVGNVKIEDNSKSIILSDFAKNVPAWYPYKISVAIDV